ncbi:MAG: serine/threonine protein phosphatase, partial [Gordonia sp.]|nr:serine/threonine protein phosphatase [Gordonia sp. (in: high G+C Gram-positive bacteria)]
YFVDYSQESGCSALDLSDLQEIDRNTLRSNAIRNKTLDEAEAAVGDLSFLPMCTPPPGSTTRTPAPRTPGRPEPSRPPSPAPATGAPTTGAPRTDLPDSTAASASVPEQTDDNGNKVCRGTV